MFGFQILFIVAHCYSLNIHTSKTSLLLQNTLSKVQVCCRVKQLGLCCELPCRLESLSGMLKIWLKEPDEIVISLARQ